MKSLTQSAIEHTALGAAVLGTGGGGDPHIRTLMAMHAIEKYGPVNVMPLEELTDDALILLVSMIGSPRVMAEKIPSADGARKALETIERAFDKEVTAVMPIEIGGVNSLIPILVAAEKRIPVLDADAMGRAFPEAQMVTFHLDGRHPNIIAMADERGNTVQFYPIDGKWSERLARSITIQMGGSAAMCDYALSGKAVKESAIPGTLSLAAEIGQILHNSDANKSVSIDYMLAKLRGYKLMTGKITFIERRIDAGFTKGNAVVEGIDDCLGRTITLYFQNEQLLAMENNDPIAITPDLISVLDKETGYPITTESLKYGERIIVTAFPCN